MSFIPVTEKKLRRKNWNLLDFRSDPESDQDPELDPDPLSRKRIRIRIKMQRIRNTAKRQQEQNIEEKYPALFKPVAHK